MSEARVELRGDGTASVKIDGHDVARHCGWIEVRSDTGRLPTLTLEIHVAALNLRADDAEVTLPSDLEDVLKALGWTPPGGR